MRTHHERRARCPNCAPPSTGWPGSTSPETDRILAALARQTAPGETAKGVARWVAGVDPDGALDDAADTRRRLTMASGLDGRVHLRGDLDAVGGEYLHAA